MNSEKIAIVTDSCADIPVKLAQDKSITVIPLQVIFGEKMYRDGIDIYPEQFYEMLDNASKLPTTAQPSPRDFMKIYQKLLANYDKVLSIHLSEKLSGTIQSARIAAQEFNERVLTWDTSTISLGAGLQVHAAAEAIEKGMKMDDIIDLLKKMQETSTTIFTLDTLEYLAKGGRIGKASSLLGSVLNIKPIIIVKDGYYHPYGKARSQKKAIKSIIDFCVKQHQNMPVKRIGIGHGMASELAEYLRGELELALGVKTIMFTQVGPVIGVHTGPGTIGVAISPY